MLRSLSVVFQREAELLNGDVTGLQSGFPVTAKIMFSQFHPVSGNLKGMDCLMDFRMTLTVPWGLRLKSRVKSQRHH